MPRMGRIVLPNYPHHVVQRGHDRQAVFAGAADFQRYLDDLRELKALFGVQVHAYCLMTNHVHLLLTPETAAGLGRLMKGLAARATRYRNKLEGRTGTLWESRFKSSPVDTDRYLLACIRYIELNPVRAGMVADPAAYRWSSCRWHLGAAGSDWLDYDPCYLGLADTPAGRAARYQAFVREATTDEEWQLIRAALQRGQLTGGARFVDQVEQIIGRRVEHRGQGRPARRSGAAGGK